MSESRHRFGILRVCLILLSIAGLVASGVLAGLSSPQAEATALSRLCAPGERIDCNHVLRSHYARIGPVSAAHAGFVYFAFLLIWFVAIGIPDDRGRMWHLVPVVAVLVGAAFSAWFTYVMAVHLPVWCSWCVAVHVINALLLVLTPAAWPRRRPERVARAIEPPATGAALRVTDAPYPSTAWALAVLGISLAIVVSTGLFLFGLYYQRESHQLRKLYLDATNREDYIQWRLGQERRVEIPLRPDDPSIGPGDAPFTVVAFSDFECPHCALLHRTAPKLVELFPGQVRFVFKHFPLSRTCNPDIRSTLHQYACEAAHAAEAARSVGPSAAFEKYCGLLFERAGELASRPYEDLAVAAGIDSGAFSRAYASGEGKGRVLEDIAAGKSVGVTGSGVVFLNGRRMSMWYVLTASTGLGVDWKRTVALWETLLGVPSKQPTTAGSGDDRKETGSTAD
jgi:protein-disulfide isomerase/uncharacterized membrane protein